MKRRFRSKSTSANQPIRLFVVIASMILATTFVMVGFVEKYRTSSSSYQNHSSMYRYINPDWVGAIFGNVLPYYQPHENGTFPAIVKQPLATALQVTSRLIATISDIDPMNLWSLLSTQIPVLHSNGFMLHTNDPSDSAKYTNPPNDKNDSTPTPDQSGQDVQAPSSATDPQNQTTPDSAKNGIPSMNVTKPVVYIYHTHNRESFLPNLAKGLQDDQAYDPEVNITDVGKRLMETLNTRGITSIQTTNDYWKYGDYPYSRITVQKELRAYPNLQMIFDIHRDSGPRNKTTTVLNGQPAARVFFIIGGSNPNYKQNLDFANRLNKKMEQLYPANGSNAGLSEGIWVKQKDPKYDYDTTYNQDLNPNMVLVEIGGPYNSLDECNRTADLLANVIQSVWQDQQKTN